MMSDNTNQAPEQSTQSKDLAATVQKQIIDFKADFLNRFNGLKEQLPLSTQDLTELKAVLQAEFNTVLEEIGQVSKEIKQDLSDISSKHKEQLVDIFQRSKGTAVDAISKVSGQKTTDDTENNNADD